MQPILLVDDDPLIVWTTELLLERAGYEVYSAQSVNEALEEVDKMSQPGALITDYFLPDGTGAELIDQLRKTLATDIPVIVMTGATQRDMDPANYPAGCVLLTKPVHFSQLHGALKSLMAMDRP